MPGYTYRPALHNPDVYRAAYHVFLGETLLGTTFAPVTGGWTGADEQTSAIDGDYSYRTRSLWATRDEAAQSFAGRASNPVS